MQFLEKKSAQPEFWNDPKEAAKISQELAGTIEIVNAWSEVEAEQKELIELGDLISPEKDAAIAADFVKRVEALQKTLQKLKLQLFLAGKFDRESAILSIHAGTGGTDAQDFAEMLLRMYIRYVENHHFTAHIIDKSPGEEAGIKSATVEIHGPFAYGYLKGEKGVHRLVRQSPFNAKHTRETSFALVEILPEIPEQTIEIKSEDLRIDTFRAGGAGGQAVNRTDSAVRITHLPTGITASCQNERSQHQNKQQAMKVLRSKLIACMEEKQAETLDELKGARIEMSWGRQIRSYVLHPYKLVKDHRTEYETSQAEAVLDGELDGFIEQAIMSPKIT